MRARIIVVTLAAAACAGAMPAYAQHVHATATSVGTTTAAPALTYIEGVVKRVDRAGGRVTIAHEAITNLDMPRMTMTFRVRDAHWLEQMKEGAHIRFAAESPNGVLTVVAYQPG